LLVCVCSRTTSSGGAEDIFRNDHPIYGMLFDLRALEVVSIIESLE
jgi:hypothetical protein